MSSGPLQRILVVEDESAMRRVLTGCLERHGYRALVAEDGERALDMIRRERPDLILLDIMMPKLDGYAVCRQLRHLSVKTPILVLTAKSRVADRVHGLELGADDYMVKPFSRDELLARVRALLRRIERARRPATEVTLGDVTLDLTKREAWKHDKRLRLTTKEWAVLRLLLETPGEAVSRDRLLDVAWGYTAFPTTRTVDRHIATLRSKIERNPNRPRWLKTIHGVGYRLDLPEQ